VNEFLLSSSPSSGGINCLTTPSTSEGAFRVTIIPDLPGQYGITEEVTKGDWEGDGLVTTGFSWTSSSRGVHYCVDGDKNITFGPFVGNATVKVSTRAVGPDEFCESDYVGYGDYIPVQPALVPPGGIAWSALRYYLQAGYFGYQVAGEDVVTAENGTSLSITGDPGGPGYHSIEASWVLDGKEKRFNGYFESNGIHWNLYEARVYNEDQDWVYFTTRNDVQGTRDSCFQRRSLVLTSLDPTTRAKSEIRFENLTLATFLPWQDQDAFDACYESASSIPADLDMGGLLNSAASSSILFVPLAALFALIVVF
jgi:hypothetical protein